MSRRPPRSTRTDTLFPYTTLFRSSYGENGDVTGIPAEIPLRMVGPHLMDLLFDLTIEAAEEAIVNAMVAAETVTGHRGYTVHAIDRSEEHTSELQSLMRISYAVFCLKKKKTKHTYTTR